MNKQQLEAYLTQLLVTYKQLDPKEHNIYEQRTIQAYKMMYAIDNYIEENPTDIDILFKKALLYDYFEDQITALECLNAIIRLEPHNTYAYIMRFMMNIPIFGVYPETFNQLCSLTNTDPKHMAMIEYTKTKYYWFYEQPRTSEIDVLNKQCLERSIALCDEYVHPNTELGCVYLSEKKFHKALSYFLKALRNIKHVYTDECFYNIISIQSYIDTKITGVILSHRSYTHILNYIDQTLHSPCSGETCEYQ